MSSGLEDLRVLQAAESISDRLWKQVLGWEVFARDVVGQQLCRAADSIGANIAEAFGRFHFGEKLHFLYYARGSLFETRYWLNRALQRGLMSAEEVIDRTKDLSLIARQLNAFASNLKTQRSKGASRRGISEPRVDYDANNEFSQSPFPESDLQWLETLPPRPIPN